MNVKKILAIAIIALAVICCLSVASAGLFDSKDDKAAVAPQQKIIELNKTDASYNVDQSMVQEAGNKFQINTADNSASMAADTKVNANITYTVTADISSLNDSDKKSLEGLNGKYSADIFFETNKTKAVAFDNVKITVDGDTLTVSGSDYKSNVLSGMYPSDMVISKIDVKANSTIVKIS